MDKEYYLYIDTTNDLCIGMLSKDFSWVSFDIFQEKASLLQAKIDDILNKNKISFSSITRVYYMAGPGSYTGMRITQGFIDFLKSEGIHCFGDYHHLLPFYSKRNEYFWVSDAFKGEFFLGNQNESHILKKEDLKEWIMNKELWGYTEKAVDGISSFSSKKIIFDHPYLLKEFIGEKKPYYYRPLSEEFSKKKNDIPSE